MKLKPKYRNSRNICKLNTVIHFFFYYVGVFTGARVTELPAPSFFPFFLLSVYIGIFKFFSLFLYYFIWLSLSKFVRVHIHDILLKIDTYTER